MELQPVFSLLTGCAASVLAGFAIVVIVLREYNRKREANFNRLNFDLQATLAQLRIERAL